MNQNQVNPKKIKAAGRIIRDQLILAVIGIPASIFIFKGAPGLTALLGIAMLLMTARLSYLLMTCDEEEQKHSTYTPPKTKTEPLPKRKIVHNILNTNMYKLTNKLTDVVIGNITGLQLQFMINHLEEESLNDKDYWLHKSLLNTFQENGADPEVILLLTAAFGENEELEIVWEKI